MKTVFLSDILVRSKAEAKPGEIKIFLAFFRGGMHPEGLGVSMACCTCLAADISSDSDESAEVVLLLLDDVKTTVLSLLSLSLLCCLHFSSTSFLFCTLASFLANTKSTPVVAHLLPFSRYAIRNSLSSSIVIMLNASWWAMSKRFSNSSLKSLSFWHWTADFLFATLHNLKILTMPESAEGVWVELCTSAATSKQ